VLKTRILSAGVFAPALFICVWQGGIYLKLTCLALAILMFWEYQNLLIDAPYRALRFLGFIATALLASLLMWNDDPTIWPFVIAGIMLCTFIALLSKPLPFKESMTQYALVLTGIFYAGALIPFLGRLRDQNITLGLGLTLCALFCTWAGDTGAYFTGRLLGKHPLAPKVSPKKTIEGALGGVCTAIAMAYIIISTLDLSVGHHHIVAFGLLAGTSGILGDLAESLIKRAAGAKDSSGIIPGHGGVLDRFDGVMFSAPVLCAYAHFIPLTA
jgi:phosphatidate cytidylyltransferase